MSGRSSRLAARDERMAVLAAAGRTASEIATLESMNLSLVYQWARATGTKLPRLSADHKARDAKVVEMVSAGMTADLIATELQIKPFAVFRVARAAGLKVKRSYQTPRNEERDARRNKMAEMYRQGITLAKIGEQFKMTRERVRQIIAALGMNHKSGGATVLASSKRDAREQAREARYLSEYGLPYAVVVQLRKDRVTHAFQAQRQSAANRGIAWGLTFAQWFAVWQTSGKLHLRGKGKGKYLMSRVNDAGGYELGNVHIQLATENSKEAVARWKGKTKANRGVFCLYPGRELAWLAKHGKKSLGFFKTEAEAVAARNAFLAAHPELMVMGRGYSHVRARKGRSERFVVTVGRKYIGSYQTTEEALAARAAYIQARDAAAAAPVQVEAA